MKCVAAAIGALALVGCGGGGATGGTGPNRYTGYFPSRTTTYTGTLESPGEVPITMTVQPNGSWTIVPTGSGDQFTLSGTMNNNLGETQWQAPFVLTPTAAGTWFGYALPTTPVPGTGLFQFKAATPNGPASISGTVQPTGTAPYYPPEAVSVTARS